MALEKPRQSDSCNIWQFDRLWMQFDTAINNRPQHRVIAAGLRQRTATRHVGQEHRQVALQVAQNSLARVVCQAPRSASATILRQQLHWLPIRQRITYKISLITHKTQTTGTPTYLSNLIHDYIPTGTLRSSNKLLLTIPRMSHDVGKIFQSRLAFSAELTAIVVDPRRLWLLSNVL